MVTDDEIIEACKNFDYMTKAAGHLGMSYTTFRQRATELGVYKPGNKGGKNVRKNIPLSEVFEGKHPDMQRGYLKKRIIAENAIEYKCANCGISEWDNKPISLNLEHKNGLRNDHRLDNLEFLCPNCHSQTDTYAGRNK